ncbi:anti-sigma factor domain-containing protein [Ensifer sp. WSM1721]|uniref:anti-sigma factor n=1 Tax=Ensifer sp. WSM1721 TaxID=1041159 RepID=UPI00047A6B72|nr:anti-sigma factor [Ensifer sp. WSM1721]
MTPQKPESGDSRRDEVIAGEYVLGVLSAEDRRRVEARIATDRNFAAMVVRWRKNLASLDPAYEPAAPPRGFAAIERISESSGAVGETSGLWSSLPLWRSLAIASLTAVAALVISMLGVFGGGSGTPLVAELAGQGTPVSLVAEFNTGSGRVRLTPAAAGQGEERSLELWLIKGSDPATSLGVLPQSGQGEILLSPGMRAKFTAGSTLAVSVEPLGGSPTGSPTGPIIARGTTRHR